MHKQPLVSVIMAIYNCEESLPASIESILNQTYGNFELIMCDDMSSDYTFQIALKYAEKHDNITVLRNSKNSKLAFSLNKSLKVAKGEYIARMDADDIAVANRLELQVDFLNNNPQYAVVGSSLIPFDKNGERKARRAKEKPDANDLLYGVPFFHPTIMMRKVVYDDLHGYLVSKRTRKGQDYDLWFRFYAKGYKGYNIQTPLLKYHESLNDYKQKRNLCYSWDMMLTKLHGFKINRFPLYLYPWVLKPIISALTPHWLMYLYHKKVR